MCEDVEELETEAKTEDKEEAEMPPWTEIPGTDNSKDIKIKEEELQTEAKSKMELEKAKEEEESLLFVASVCSTWTPSVVGDPRQRFFLKAGEVFGLSFLCQNPLYIAKLPMS